MPATDRERIQMAGLALGFLVLVAVGIVLAWAAWGVWKTAEPEDRGSAFLLVVLALGAFVGSFFVLREIIIRSVTEISLTVNPEKARLGETVELDVRVRTKRELKVGQVVLGLGCSQHAVRGSGKQSRHYKKEMFEAKHVAAKDITLTPGLMHRWRASFQIPRDGMHSFECPSNEIRWEARLWMAVPGAFPDVRRNWEITVVPRRVKEGREE